MSIIGSNILAGASGSQGFDIQRSLRLNSGDSPYLSQTPSSGLDTKTWTISLWIKKISAAGYVIRAGEFYLYFTSDQLHYYDYSGSANSVRLKTNAVFRDPSAWYHIVLANDTTQATATNRHRLYVNGDEVTSFATDSAAAQNAVSYLFNSSYTINIGGGTASNYPDCYLAEVHFVHGSQLAPSNFGETDSSSGAWIPKQYGGSHGTGGSYLKFADNNGVTATTLGKDSSGNGNNWTPNNFSVTAGTGNDSLEDTPTNNWCTLNPLNRGSDNPTVSNGNLYLSSPSTDHTVVATFAIPSSGKWYWEYSKTANANLMSGIIHSPETGGLNTYLGGQNNGYSVYATNGQKYTGAIGNQTYMATPPTSTTITIAFDADTNKLYFGADGNWGDGSGNTDETFANAAVAYTVPTGNTYYPAISFNGGNAFANFGQRAFDHTPPAGYKALNTANLPVPTIKKGTEYFDSKLWTATGTDPLPITGLEFSPDFVWAKARNDGYNHVLVDRVRGVNNVLVSNGTNAESSVTTVTQFNSDGFNAGGTANNNFSLNCTVSAARTYVAWNWDAGANSSKTFTVKVVSDSGNKYRFDDFGTSAVTLDLEEGSTYVFDQSDSSNSGHPLRFSTTSDGTHGSGSEYTTGVTTTGSPGSAGAKTTIVVAASAPTLYYYCSAHSGMGGQANTNSTAGASNFAGSIQSTVRANTEAGFSIVSYTGTGANATVGHNLNQAPEMVIVKDRDRTTDWSIMAQHANNGSGHLGWIRLNLANAWATTAILWNNTAPTSSVFSIGTYDYVNYSGSDYIALCFNSVEGYSKIGSYTGNGSADGAFVYTGFRPSWVLIKRTDNVGNWWIHDAQRNTFNVVDNYLFADTSAAEASFDNLDFLSNGFKLRLATYQPNTSGGTFIYMAFAETPFKYANAR